MIRKNSVKERILETASRLFYQQGFNSTGINQIIAEAEIAIGSLYKHYASKNELLYHYLEAQEKQYFKNLDQELNQESDAVSKLLKLIDYRIQLQKEENCLGCHFIKIHAEVGRQDEKLNQIVRAHKQKQRLYLQTILDEISQNQAIPLEKVYLLHSLWFMLEGAVVSCSIHGNTKDLEAVKQIVLQVF